MTYKYEILREAQVEIDSIIAYLVSLAGDPVVARAFLDEFHKQVALVCSNPTLFGLSRMPELAALGYRTFFVKNYVVIYFVRGDSVYIAHVFHQRQDYARLI